MKTPKCPRRTSHEVRGLKLALNTALRLRMGRTSHEVRGLKLWGTGTRCDKWRSHLTRGAWIETRSTTKSASNTSRTSHEVRGLKR